MKVLLSGILFCAALGAKAYTCTAAVETRPGVIKTKALKRLTAYTKTAKLKGINFSTSEILGDHITFEIFSKKGGRFQELQPLPALDGQDAVASTVLAGKNVSIICQER